MKMSDRSTHELVDAAHAAFAALETQMLDKNFVSLQACLETSMESIGGSQYKLPNGHKARRRDE